MPPASEATPPPAAESRSGRVLLVLTWVVVACILIQAALAGIAWFQTPDLFELHGWLGSALLAPALATTALLFRTPRPLWARLASLAVVVGSFLQIGLGYAGHRGGLAVASAVHVPLGVTLLGLAVAVAVAVSLTEVATEAAPSARR